ncbi:helix-turn-helix domain-containing protein [Dietzia timorensis]
MQLSYLGLRNKRESTGRVGAARSPVLDVEPLWREALGMQLRRIRHERKERLIDTAEKAGVSPQFLSEMERGLKDPSSEMIAAIAGALGVSLGELTQWVSAQLESAKNWPAGPAGGDGLVLAA